MAEPKKQLVIEIDEEFLDILNKLESKIKIAAWDGLEKVSKKTLTKILARKITASKIL